MSDDEKQKSEVMRALLEYHHKAMDSRRSIGFKAFLSLVALDLLVLKGAYEIKFSISDTYSLRLLLWVAYGVLCAFFIAFTLQIENANRQNRRKYHELETVLRRFAGLKIDDEMQKESSWSTLKRSWSGTWPVLTIVMLTAGCCLVVSLVYP